MEPLKRQPEEPVVPVPEKKTSKDITDEEKRQMRKNKFKPISDEPRRQSSSSISTTPLPGRTVSVENLEDQHKSVEIIKPIISNESIQQIEKIEEVKVNEPIIEKNEKIVEEKIEEQQPIEQVTQKNEEIVEQIGQESDIQSGPQPKKVNINEL